MKGHGKNRKNKDYSNINLSISNSLSYSEDNKENEFSILNEENSKIIEDKRNFIKKKKKKIKIMKNMMIYLKMHYI